MIRIPIVIPSQREQHEDDLWIRSECYRFYANERRRHCSYTELMDLWLRAPYCVECGSSGPFQRLRDPDISPTDWKMDLLWEAGPAALANVEDVLAVDSEFCLLCKRCGRELRPWENQALYVVEYHLEEHYGIPIETPGRKQPSRNLQQQVMSLYGNVCFNCGVAKAETPLHIDHIMPQSKKGDSAFRNLQPLCEECGNTKADTIPNTVQVFSNIYFGPYPPETHEGLFW